ncbi:MAG: hypothetical protein K2G67_01975 [Muribaculaceae bacterium]|nr:hypothetical protein [Muribaculaceae bacterium]
MVKPQKFLLILVVISLSLTYSNYATAQKQISAWDFYTKYLSNAYEFQGSYISNSYDTFTYEEHSHNRIQTELQKTRWSLKKKSGCYYIITGAQEFLSNITYDYNTTETISRSNQQFLQATIDISTLKDYPNNRKLEMFMFGSLLTIPVLRSDNSIVFTHNEDFTNEFQEYQYENYTEKRYIKSPIWEISNSSQLSFIDAYGDDYHFSCNFNPKNIEHYKVISNVCPGLPSTTFSPRIDKIILKIDRPKLRTYDEYGEWKWNSKRDTIWVESKGEGILNSRPIKFSFIPKNRETTCTEYEYSMMPAIHILKDDSSETDQVRPLPLNSLHEGVTTDQITLEGIDLSKIRVQNELNNGDKIYELLFNFGEGNILLKFASNKKYNDNILTFCSYNRFKNEIDFDASKILDQIKQKEYCVLTIKEVNNNYQSYVFHLEGLESIIENLK